ncbi:hypothetical protein [Pseudomonas viridiflava]|nr:hypothetical protein [Pseudomonas viridiflava]
MSQCPIGLHPFVQDVQGKAMRKGEIPTELSLLAFDFFYWFSRFEFCLKENGYLKFENPGQRAEPGWDRFVERHAETYVLTAEAAELLAAPPDRQVVGAGLVLEWVPVGFQDCRSDLAKVVRAVKTVRNNLFHGGKHGAAGWDSPQRAQSLITWSASVLEGLVELGGLRGDYERFY